MPQFFLLSFSLFELLSRVYWAIPKNYLLSTISRLSLARPDLCDTQIGKQAQSEEKEMFVLFCLQELLFVNQIALVIQGGPPGALEAGGPKCTNTRIPTIGTPRSGPSGVPPGIPILQPLICTNIFFFSLGMLVN